MAIVSDLKIRLGADTVEFAAKMNRALASVAQHQKQLEQMSRSMTKVGRQMAMSVSAPLAAIGAVSVKLADVQAAAEAKVQQALKSTQNAARLNYEQLAGYASKLQGKTIFGDEEILNKSTAQLLTFTNIAGDNFKRAQAVAMDLATVLDGDLKGASIQLGKALNDPVTSLSALRKSGIQFTAEQEAMIKSLANSGQVAKAQAVILDELERQYGGQAAARAKAGAGAVVQMKNAWGDMMEMCGRVLMPTVNKVAKTIQGMVERVQQMSPGLQKLIIGMGAVAAGAGPMLLAFGAITSAAAACRAAMLGLTAATSATPWGLVITAVAAAGAGLVMLATSSDKARYASTEHSKAVAAEGSKVNGLIAKLAGANTAEADRRKVLEELGQVQPSIVAGLGDESLQLDVLKRRAVEYNEQLIIRMALAKRQDAVDSAADRRNEAGVKKLEAQMAVLETLGKIPEELNSIKVSTGGLVSRFLTEDEKKSILKSYSEIMASNDDYLDKAKKVRTLFSNAGHIGSIAGIIFKSDAINVLLRDVVKLTKAEKELAEANSEVDEAMQGVKAFKDQYAQMLGVVDGGSGSIGGWVAGLVKSVEAMDSAEVKMDAVKRAIKELNNKRAEVTNPLDLEQIDNAVAKLRTMMTEQEHAAMGIIEKMQAKIKELEDAKVAATTREQIEKLNEELRETKSLLDAVLNIRAIGNTTPIARGKKVQGAGVSVTPSGDAPKIKVPDISGAINVYNEAVAQAGKFSGTIENMANKSIKKAIDGGATFNEAMQKMAEDLKAGLELGKQIAMSAGELMGSMVTEIGSTLVSGVGRMAVGDMGFGEIINQIKAQIGDFMIQMGKMLVLNSTAIESFKKAMNAAWLSGPAGIAIGAGLVAAGAALKAAIEADVQRKVPKLAKGGLAYAATYAMVGDNPNARVDPEVIAPLSKLQEIIKPRGGGVANVRIGGEVRVRGQDLVIALENAGVRGRVMDERRRG